MTLNVRQVISILLSCATYGHRVTPLQVGGLLLVFGALFHKNITKFIRKYKLDPRSCCTRASACSPLRRCYCCSRRRGADAYQSVTPTPRNIGAAFPAEDMAEDQSPEAVGGQACTNGAC